MVNETYQDTNMELKTRILPSPPRNKQLLEILESHLQQKSVWKIKNSKFKSFDYELQGVDYITSDH